MKREETPEDLPEGEVEITLRWPKIGTTEAVLTYTRCDDPREPSRIPEPGEGPLQVWWRAQTGADHHGSDGVFYQTNDDSPGDEWVFTLRGRLANDVDDDGISSELGRLSRNSDISLTADLVERRLGLDIAHENELFASYRSHSDFVPSNLMANLANLYIEAIPYSSEWIIRYRNPNTGGEADWRVDVRYDLVDPALFTIIRDEHDRRIYIYQGLVNLSRQRTYKYRVRASDGYQVWGTINLFDHYTPD